MRFVHERDVGALCGGLSQAVEYGYSEFVVRWSWSSFDEEEERGRRASGTGSDVQEQLEGEGDDGVEAEGGVDEDEGMGFFDAMKLMIGVDGTDRHGTGKEKKGRRDDGHERSNLQLKYEEEPVDSGAELEDRFSSRLPRTVPIKDSQPTLPPNTTINPTTNSDTLHLQPQAKPNKLPSSTPKTWADEIDKLDRAIDSAFEDPDTYLPPLVSRSSSFGFLDDVAAAVVSTASSSLSSSLGYTHNQPAHPSPLSSTSTSQSSTTTTPTPVGIPTTHSYIYDRQHQHHHHTAHLEVPQPRKNSHSMVTLASSLPLTLLHSLWSTVRPSSATTTVPTTASSSASSSHNLSPSTSLDAITLTTTKPGELLSTSAPSSPTSPIFTSHLPPPSIAFSKSCPGVSRSHADVEYASEEGEASEGSGSDDEDGEGHDVNSIHAYPRTKFMVHVVRRPRASWEAGTGQGTKKRGEGGDDQDEVGEEEEDEEAQDELDILCVVKVLDEGGDEVLNEEKNQRGEQAGVGMLTTGPAEKGGKDGEGTGGSLHVPGVGEFERTRSKTDGLPTSFSVIDGFRWRRWVSGRGEQVGGEGLDWDSTYLREGDGITDDRVKGESKLRHMPDDKDRSGGEGGLHVEERGVKGQSQSNPSSSVKSSDTGFAGSVTTQAIPNSTTHTTSSTTSSTPLSQRLYRDLEPPHTIPPTLLSSLRTHITSLSSLSLSATAIAAVGAVGAHAASAAGLAGLGISVWPFGSGAGDEAKANGAGVGGSVGERGNKTEEGGEGRRGKIVRGGEGGASLEGEKDGVDTFTKSELTKSESLHATDHSKTPILTINTSNAPIPAQLPPASQAPAPSPPAPAPAGGLN
ncbi:hypothetical protein HK102_008245, partial [Quaeritorhiza haematococci]